MSEKLKKLQDLMQMVNDGLSKKDFLDAFKNVIDYIKKTEEKLINKMESKTEKAVMELDEMKIEYKGVLEETKKECKEMMVEMRNESQSTLSNVSNESQSTLSNVKRWAMESVGKLFAKSQINEKLAQVEDKLKELNDYELPDASTIALEASKMVQDGLLPLIPIVDKIEEKLPKMGDKIRDSLEALKGNERLDAKAIKGLEERIEKLTKEIGRVGQTAIGLASRTITNHETFNGDGSTTEFTLTDGVASSGNAAWIYLNGQFLVNSTHWSIDGTKLTLTFTPTNDDKIDCTYIKA